MTCDLIDEIPSPLTIEFRVQILKIKITFYKEHFPMSRFYDKIETIIFRSTISSY